MEIKFISYDKFGGLQYPLKDCHYKQIDDILKQNLLGISSRQIPTKITIPVIPYIYTSIDVKFFNMATTNGCIHIKVGPDIEKWIIEQYIENTRFVAEEKLYYDEYIDECTHSGIWGISQTLDREFFQTISSRWLDDGAPKHWGTRKYLMF